MRSQFARRNTARQRDMRGRSTSALRTSRGTVISAPSRIQLCVLCVPYVVRWSKPEVPESPTGGLHERPNSRRRVVFEMGDGHDGAKRRVFQRPADDISDAELS